MSIQHDEANALEKSGMADLVFHIWEKEYFLATRTGDYRCSICGASISGDTYKEKIERKGEKKENECN